MNRTAQSSLAILGVLALGVGSWRWIVSLERPPATAPPRDLGPVPVSVERVPARELELECEAFGNLEVRRRAFLTAEVSGRVVEVHADWRPGARVAQGELLVRLDPRLYALDVEAAQAASDEARAREEEARVAVERGGASLAKARERLTVAVREHERQVELDVVSSESQRDASLRARIEAELAVSEGESAVDAASAAQAMGQARARSAAVALERAREQLARTEIRAPFAGRLRGQAPGLGTLATPGLALGELLDDSRLVLSVRVPETDLRRIRPGQTARVRFPSTPETIDAAAHAARVVAVDAASDPETRRGVVELELLSEGNGPAGAGLPAGLFAQATIELERLAGVTWIDRRYLRWEDGEPVAYVLASGAPDSPEARVARRRVLALGREHGRGFVVERGLAPGDTLVLRPLDRMREGVAVRVLGGEGGGP